MLKVYLAKPMKGHSYEWVKTYIDAITSLLQGVGYFIHHPLVGKDKLSFETNFKATGYDEFPTCTDNAIASKDCWGVRNSDIVFADLSNVKEISIGCMFEIAWAQILGKLIIVVMEKGNVHEHAIVNHAISIRFYNIDDAVEYLKKIITSQV